jgi:hypothetical protein
VAWGGCALREHSSGDNGASSAGADAPVSRRQSRMASVWWIGRFMKETMWDFSSVKFEPKIPPNSLQITRCWSFLLQMVNLSKCYRMLLKGLAPGS